MTDKIPAQPASPPGATSRLEVDTFCAGCSYNLHGQNVWRDENLGLMVCRCPECGKFHPAGTGVSASSVWLNRLAFMLLTNWIFICLIVLFLGGGILFGMQMAYLEDFTVSAYVTPDGQIVDVSYQNQINNPASQPQNYTPTYTVRGTGQIVPIATVRRVYRAPVEYGPNGVQTAQPLWEVYMPFVLVNFFDSLILGIFIAAAMFHIRRRTYYFLILPILAGLVAFLVWRTESHTNAFTAWSLGCIALWCLYDMFFLAAGIAIGRPVARLTISLIVPPKPRQYFAFLWLADGKAYPSTIAKA